MKAAEMAELILEASKRLESTPRQVEAFNALAAAIRLCGDEELDVALSRIRQPKPKANRPVPQAAILSAQLEILRDDFLARIGNHAATMEVVNRIEQLPKPEVVSIAASIGMKTNSKTSKTLAIQHLRGKSSEAERDAALREKIRKGA